MDQGSRAYQRTQLLVVGELGGDLAAARPSPSTPGAPARPHARGAQRLGSTTTAGEGSGLAHAQTGRSSIIRCALSGFSIGAGAAYLPLAVLKEFLTRPVILSSPLGGRSPLGRRCGKTVFGERFGGEFGRQ